MNLHEKAETIYQRLIEGYGQPIWQPGQDPVDELIGTILSANTNDVNSGRAFEQLKAAFGDDWDAVRNAPLEAIKTAIRPAGMYNQKAPNIVAVLERLKREQSAYNLDHLAGLDVADALDYLTSFPGVGHKTASIVLLFCFNCAAFPVDTHVQRISQHLGISDWRASPIKIKVIWEDLLPAETFYPLHINLIRHGRQICQARQPRCELCVVQSVCDYFQGEGDWALVS